MLPSLQQHQHAKKGDNNKVVAITHFCFKQKEEKNGR
jgi:hypothetical protein